MLALTSFIGKSTEHKNISFLGRTGLFKVILKDIQKVRLKRTNFLQDVGVRCYQEVECRMCKRRRLIHRCFGNIFQWHSHLIKKQPRNFLGNCFTKCKIEVFVKYSFQNNTKDFSLMYFCMRAFGGGKIPRLNGFFETGRQRLPTACCHYFLRFKCACVNRDLAALRNISKTIRYPNCSLHFEFWTNAIQ